MKYKYIEGDLVGNNNIKFIKLTEPYIHNRGSKPRALFRCFCGTEFVTRVEFIRRNKTISCGCSKKIHGMSRDKDYHYWSSVITRCYNKNRLQYKDYGGRGIKIYSGWRHNPKLFIEYIKTLDNYGKPGYTLDRVNNNGDYKPGNLRWATRQEQNSNKRTQYAIKNCIN